MDLTKIDKPFGELDRETKIALFAAWVDGARIERAGSSINAPAWHAYAVYRVAPTKPSIDWSHVAPQFRWMATDVDGKAYIYSSNPRLSANQWVGDGAGCGLASSLASFRAGTCDWKYSLVQRPEGV